MKVLTPALCCALLFSAIGCGMKVDITKTVRGFHAPSDPDNIEILMMRPNRSFTELGAITVYRCPPSDTARMHNALRAKAAPLGADAVVLQNSGIDGNDYLWATGAAILYTDE